MATVEGTDVPSTVVDLTAGPGEGPPEALLRARRRRRAWLQAAALALPVLVLALLAWRSRYVFDDGFIYLRIVSNLLDGYGPVFNAGERVEAYTGTLWVAFLALAGMALPLPLEWIAVLSGIAMTLGALVVAMATARRLSRTVAPGAFLLPIGALVWIALPPVWKYASTGLETGLSFLWLALCAWLMVRWAADDLPPRWYAMMILGVGILVRPEFVVTSAILVGAVLAVDWRRTSWAQRGRTVAWAVALPVAYQVFRMAYFGMLVSNPAVAKEGTKPRLDAGLAYLADFVGPYWLALPLSVLLAGGLVPLLILLPRRRRMIVAVLALPVAGLVNALMVTVVGGDYLHARLYLPALFAMLIPVMVLPVTRQFLVSLLVLPWVVVCAVALRPPTQNFPFTVIGGDGKVTLADFGVKAGAPETSWYDGAGLYVRFGITPLSPVQRLDVPAADVVPGSALILWAIGVESYFRGPEFYIYDGMGLADVTVSHLELTQRGHTGHEKDVPTPWLAAELTREGTSTTAFDEFAAVRASVLYPPIIPATTGAVLAEQTAWARATLQCPAVADLRAAAREPLTPGRALSNVLGSFGRTQLRIPADPETAYRTLCSDAVPAEVAALRSDASQSG